MIPMRSNFFTACVLTAFVVLAGCGSNPAAPTSSAPFSQSDIRVGTGAEATNGKRLSVAYTLWLYDASQPDGKGRQMQSNVGQTPFTFTLGAGFVIDGWDRGCVGMREGGIRRLIIPPDLAYGSSGQGDIPGNATLVFDIELFTVL